MTQATVSQMSQNMQQCIKNCLDCHSVCLNTIAYCLQKGGHHAQASHISLLQDCAQICVTSADFMLRGSDLHSHTCGVCAEICDRMGDDAQMKACADMCRRCAESCRQMAMR